MNTLYTSYIDDMPTTKIMLNVIRDTLFVRKMFCSLQNQMILFIHRTAFDFFF